MKKIRIDNICKTNYIHADGSSHAKLTVSLTTSDNSQEENNYELWYDVDAKWGDYLCDDRCDGIIVQIFLTAMKAHYSVIESPYPISTQLWYNLTYHIIPQLSLMGKRRYTKIRIDAPHTKERYDCQAVGTGMSRGIDSFATFFEYYKFPEDKYRLTHLTYFNIGAHHGQGDHSRTMHDRYLGQLTGTEEFCNKYGYPLIWMDTNLPEFLRAAFVHWRFDRTHTYRNLGCVLILQKLFRCYYYSSTYNLDAFEPAVNIDCAHYEKWVIPLLSTENTAMYNSNQDWERIEKTRFLAEHPECYDHLLVCFRDDNNCGKCAKCQRTLMQLDSLGGDIIGRFKNSFDLDSYYTQDRKKWFDDIDDLMVHGLMPTTYVEAFYEALRNRPELVENSSHLIKFDPAKKVVSQKKVAVRLNPSLKSDILYYLSKGHVLETAMECDGFYKVVSPDGSMGWATKEVLIAAQQQVEDEYVESK